MLARVNGSLMLKLLLTLFLILGISFAGLCLFILNKQNTLLTQMSQNVAAALTAAGSESRQDLDTLQAHANTLLETMKANTAENISAATGRALDAEEKKIQAAMESLLVENAQGILALLESVVPTALMRENIGDLLKFSKAAAQTPDIVFTFFFDKAGEPLPGYINARDAKIKAYLNQIDAEDEIPDLVKLARKDSQAMVFEKPVEYYGDKIGTIIICMDREAISVQIRELTQRLDQLNHDNGTRINQSLALGSDNLNLELNRALARVTQKNQAAIQSTGEILKASAATVKANTGSAIALMGIACSLGLLALAGLFFQVMVVRPIRHVSDGLMDTAQGEGDLTKRLDARRRDEIGTLAKWFNAFLERLNQIISGINANAHTVARASEQSLAEAGEILQGTTDLSQRARTVAAATEEMSTNMDSVAAASEQAAVNMKKVSDAADEMQQALTGVADHCGKARQVTETAKSDADTCSDKVAQLGEAAKQINRITEVITDIAEQTNLLALNATIEAARAGEAGKGFAVVASEIKGLAAQTTAATQDITLQIQGIQSSTSDTVDHVGRITGTITQMNQLIAQITREVEDQSDAASGVAVNVSQASAGIDEINTNVAHSSQVSTQIAGDIARVNSVAETMAQQSRTMEVRSRELSESSQTLKQMIRVFKIA